MSALVDFSHSKPSDILDIFKLANSLYEDLPDLKQFKNQTAALFFFEPSTRTRLSFETACVRVGLHPIIFDDIEATSISKGESILDTLKNVSAMQPRVLVVRCGDDFNLKEFALNSTIPVINAGWGKLSHPTQALLDAFTIYKEFGQVAHQKVLIVGDIKHSRVAGSNVELLQLLGAEVKFCAPKYFLPDDSPIESFSNIDEGLNWADCVMALRVQHERHDSKNKIENYSQFQINHHNLRSFKNKGILMHPGPVNWGVELSHEVAEDPRCRILQQVQLGVYIREAIIRKLCGAI